MKHKKAGYGDAQRRLKIITLDMGKWRDKGLLRCRTGCVRDKAHFLFGNEGTVSERCFHKLFASKKRNRGKKIGRKRQQKRNISPFIFSAIKTRMRVFVGKVNKRPKF